jgi:hypothetical protein
MAYDPSNPNKYKNQASEYSGMVSGINSELGVALSELGVVNDTLGFNAVESAGVAAGDASSCKDVLTYNVIVSNEEIKSEITSLQSELGVYTSVLSNKAKEFDEEELREYLEEQKRLEALKKKNNENQEETQ